MAKVRANPRWHVPGSSGAIANGWKVYTYIAGTSTPKDTYTDHTEGTPNANPVVLDSRGEAPIYWSKTYKVVVKDDADVTIWTEDNYGGGEEFVQVGNYNLVQNGSFETTTSGEPDEWTLVDYTNGAHAIDATDQYHGLNSLKFTSTGTGGGYATSAYFEVQEAKDIFVDWAMRSSVTDVRNVVDIIWYTSAKSSISTTNIYDDSTTNPTSWAAKAGTATPPSTARYAQVRVYGCHSSDSTSGSTWFDDVESSSLQAATATRKGIAEIATQAEVDAGTDTSKYVTPETLTGYVSYEEGTWTPTLNDNVSGIASLASSAGTYEKIGRQVTVRGELQISSAGTMTTGTYNTWIKGLPYSTSISAGENSGGGSISSQSAVTVASGTFAGTLRAYNDYLALLKQAASATTDVKVSEISFGGTHIFFTATYMAA